MAERAALAEVLKSALTSVALADTVAAQVADARDRLASRLELLTSRAVSMFVAALIPPADKSVRMRPGAFISTCSNPR